MKQFVAFRLGNELYGIPITQVHEIIQRPEMTRLPQMPDFVEGIINLRGKIVPVIDLRRRFNMPDSEDKANARIVVTQMSSQLVGMVVDSVQGVSNLQEEAIEPLPESIQAIEREYLDGIGKMQDGIIILINLEKVLTETEKSALLAPEEK